MNMTSAIALISLALLAGCGNDGESPSSPPGTISANVVVRQRLAALHPAAILAHRGMGVNTSGKPFAENSLAGYAAGMAAGADGIELDVEMTSDGRLVIMHDDTLNRTTTCTGCVSAYTYDVVRQCRLRDGNGTVTGEPPPTLDEVFALVKAPALVNIEMKSYDAGCLTETNGPSQLAAATVAAIRRLGVAERVVLSSFNAAALRAARDLAPDIYTGYLVNGLTARTNQTALDLKADAINPNGAVVLLAQSTDLIRAALDAGLQVNTWTIDDAPSINSLLDHSVTTIITNEPATVRQVFQSRP